MVHPRHNYCRGVHETELERSMENTPSTRQIHTAYVFEQRSILYTNFPYFLGQSDGVYTKHTTGKLYYQFCRYSRVIMFPFTMNCHVSRTLFCVRIVCASQRTSEQVLLVNLATFLVRPADFYGISDQLWYVHGLDDKMLFSVESGHFMDIIRKKLVVIGMVVEWHSPKWQWNILYQFHSNQCYSSDSMHSVIAVHSM